MAPRLTKSMMVYARDRDSYRYVEHATIRVSDGSISVNGEPVPCAGLGCLMIGPGSTISHDAVVMLNMMGVLVEWTSNDGLSMQSVALPQSSDSSRVTLQIRKSYGERNTLISRLFSMRYPREPAVDDSTSFFMAEAILVKRDYKTIAERHGVAWNGRIPRICDMSSDDIANRCITLGNIVLYSVAASVIYLNGLLPQIGILHSRGSLPLAYDIADVCKMETSVPYAFMYAKNNTTFDAMSFYDGLSFVLNDMAITKRMTSILKDLFDK